ncbi:6-bladed beta-propeller, partial [Parabacteroides sp. OttesenSCG-928-G07]|nr:6-bladed beta-propeller [Parabacteroides sp. OttesenSCG-928-G07]
MKLRNLSYAIILFVFFSCSNRTEHVERIDQDFTIVTDSIESMMPVQLSVYGDYIIWCDALGKEEYVHVLDKTTGKELTKFVDIGQGPEEFVSPSVGYIQNNKVFIYDPNLDKVAYYSLDVDNFNAEFIKTDRVRRETRYLVIDGEVLSFNSSLEKPFKWKNTYWGKTFFDPSIKNHYSVSQGNVLYNPYNQSLVYSVMSYHYMSLYKVKNGNIELVSERIGNVDYDIVNDEVK